MLQNYHRNYFEHDFAFFFMETGIVSIQLQIPQLKPLKTETVALETDAIRLQTAFD